MLAESSQLPPNSGCFSNGTVVEFKEDQDKNFLDELQGMMNNINQRIRELETSCTLIGHNPNAAASLFLGKANIRFCLKCICKISQFLSFVQATLLILVKIRTKTKHCCTGLWYLRIVGAIDCTILFHMLIKH